MKNAVELMDLVEKFGTDEKCRETLAHLRWPDGIKCLRCKSENVAPVADRKVHVCYSCQYQFSATVGTIFHDSHLPLTKWFFVTYLLCESRKGISANQIKRMQGVSYKTAWYLCHRIRAAMALVPPVEKMTGKVEVDETYVGGKPRYHRVGVPGRTRAIDGGKEVVIGIRQRNSEKNPSGELRFFHADDVKSGTLAKYIRENISTDVDVILTDDFIVYPPAIAKAGIKTEHVSINHSKKIYAYGDFHTNTVESAFSLLKRGIVGTWHKVSAKHLEAYLNEMCFRFNNRKNPYLFRDTLLKMLESENVEYKELTAKGAAA